MRRSSPAMLALLLLWGCGTAPPKPAEAPIQFDRVSQATIAHGERTAAILGCSGCHGPKLQGENWSEAGFASLWTSNLTRAAQVYRGDGLEAVIRSGVRPDGSTLWGMPSHLFTHLTAEDMDAVIAYIRSVPPDGATHPRPVFEAAARKEIADGTWKSARVEVREMGSQWPGDAGKGHALGRYIARATCAECHGMNLKGSTPYPGAAPRPDLTVILSAYSRDDFRTLMRTGKAMGGRELKLMSEVARGRYNKLTDREIDALHAYLQALGTTSP